MSSQMIAQINGRTPYVGDVFGIEIEIEGAIRSRLQDSRDDFSIENDGSLRNGCELVSRPLSYEEIIKRFPKWQAIFRKLRFITTPRCSTHVHVNVSDMSPDQFSNFMYLSICLEPLLMELAGPMRNGNTYCVPTYMSINQAADIRRVINRVLESRRVDFTSPKYTAISLFRFRDLCTVEFRMFAGITRDLQQLRQLLRLLKDLRFLAMSYSIDELRDMKRLGEVASRLVRNIPELSDIDSSLLKTLLTKGEQMAEAIYTGVLTEEELLNLQAKYFKSSVTGPWYSDLTTAEDIIKLIGEMVDGLEPDRDILRASPYGQNPTRVFISHAFTELHNSNRFQSIGTLVEAVIKFKQLIGLEA